jgi:hypothetical protein
MARSALHDVVVGGAQVAATLLTAPVARRRYNRWGATDDEVTAAMPGDDLVAEPRLSYTRAVTIAAARERVWPWLAQIGQGRGGLYSFDGLENLVRCDIHSVDRILPEHQDLAAGDLVRMGPPGYPCFRVHSADAPAALVLVGADPRPPHAAASADSPTGISTWQWQLRAVDSGRSTRLLVRQRLTYPDGQALVWHLVEPVAFVMERQMLLGLRHRAEGRIPTA